MQVFTTLFTKRLRFDRRRAGMTQQEVADTVGVCKQAVKNWESSRNFPNNDNIKSLLALFESPELFRLWTKKR